MPSPRVARFLFLLTGAAWCVYGLVTLADAVTSSRDVLGSRLGRSVLFSLGALGVAVGCGLLVRARWPRWPGFVLSGLAVICFGALLVPLPSSASLPVLVTFGPLVAFFLWSVVFFLALYARLHSRLTAPPNSTT